MRNEFFRSGKLKSLTMNVNYLYRLERLDFRFTPNLEHLNLAFNDITVIENEVFSGLSKLQGLYLYSNKISHLDSKIFDGLISLETLFLDHNRLEVLPQGLFKNTQKLIRISLHENSIFSIYKNFKDDLPNLLNFTFTCNECAQQDFHEFDGSLGRIQKSLENCLLPPQKTIEVRLGKARAVLYSKYRGYRFGLPGYFDGLIETKRILLNQLNFIIILTFVASILSLVSLFFTCILIKKFVRNQFED